MYLIMEYSLNGMLVVCVHHGRVLSDVVMVVANLAVQAYLTGGPALHETWCQGKDRSGIIRRIHR